MDTEVGKLNQIYEEMDMTFGEWWPTLREPEELAVLYILSRLEG